ncbi:MAG TPA: FUSC family protein, partial [Pseudonocardia sp.]|nr:FUSC family protein [Pseudonocardia sp.]
TPEHHTLLVRRAIRELLLSIVQMRRTTLRLQTEAGAGSRGSAGSGSAGGVAGREERLEEDDGDWLDQEPDVDEPSTRPAAAAPATEAAVASRAKGLNPATRAGIQAAIGGALAIAGGELLSAQRWYWAVIAGYIVFAGTNSRGDLLVKGWRRIWGTLLGIIAGTVLATLLAGKTELNVVVALVCIFLAFYTLRVSYATMTFFITVMLGMLYDILGTFAPNVLLLRLAETAIGVTGSVVAAMLVLPTRTRATVLTELNDYFAALRDELLDAERLLVQADRVSVIAATREVDRAAAAVGTAIAPMLHRLSPSRVRRGHATRLLTLTDESSLTARQLARAAEPGALAGIPEAAHTLGRLIANTEALLAATEVPPKTARLVSGSELAPRVDVRAQAEASSTGAPDRLRLLHLRRVINGLDRLDKQLLGMAAPLAQTISVPRREVVPESAPPRRPRPEPAAAVVAGADDHRAAAGPEDSSGDSRDRLLHVLLEEPERALDAAADLLSSRHELDRSGGSRRRSRERLAASVGRLRAAGLTSAQIAELAGFTEDELVALLAGSSPRPTGTNIG